MSNLNEIKAILENRQYLCEIVPNSEQLPYDQLAVALDSDSQGRPQLLVIRPIPQNLSQNDALLGISAKERTYQEFQFISALPFTISEEKFLEIARFILLINKGMEIPGFELSEVDRQIFFRYACIFPGDDIDERILLSLVGMIELLLATFSELLEDIGTGKRSLHEVIEEAKQLIKS